MVLRHRLCHLDALPDPGSKGFTVNGEPVFVVKQRGRVYLYRNQCPHIGIALEWVEDQFLDISHTMIQCANHGLICYRRRSVRRWPVQRASADRPAL
jgi:nitrite reductase/ring-hydroxylating ferredoxin subunit